MLLLLSQNAIVLPVLKWGEIKTVTWFLLTLKSIMIITEKSKPLHCCGHLTTLAEITQCLLWSFPLFVRRIPGKGADGCWVSVHSLPWKCSTTREVMSPKPAELRRSWALGLISSWNIKPRLLLSGPAGFSSPGAFLKWQKKRVDFLEKLFSGKALPYKVLAALHTYFLWDTGGNLLRS